MSAPTPPDTVSDEDEISLADIVAFLSDNFKALILGALAALVLAGGYLGFAPARYKATANVQMASVDGELIEAPAVLVEKLKLPLYFSQDSWRTCGTDDERRPSRTLAKELSPTVNRNAPFVSLTFTGPSPAAATACLEAVVREIGAKQSDMSLPLIAIRQANLKALKEKQAEVQALLKLLPKIQSGTSFSDAKFPAVSLMLATALTKEAEMRELQQDIAEAELNLASPKTQGTTLAAPIYAPNVPSGPAAWVVLLAASVAGAMLAAVLLLVRNALRRQKR